MSNRRSHPRFELTLPCDSSFRLVYDVSIRRAGPHGFVCLGAAPGIVGEVVTLEILGAGSRALLRARVVGSRPVAVNGSLRNELRLEPTGDEAAVERQAALAGSVAAAR